MLKNIFDGNYPIKITFTGGTFRNPIEHLDKLGKSTFSNKQHVRFGLENFSEKTLLIFFERVSMDLFYISDDLNRIVTYKFPHFTYSVKCALEYCFDLIYQVATEKQISILDCLYSFCSAADSFYQLEDCFLDNYAKIEKDFIKSKRSRGKGFSK